MLNRDFWRRRRVLVTGHTGFKGSWTVALLHRFGAEVGGLALAADGQSNLWSALAPRLTIAQSIVDLRDGDAVSRACRRFRPEIVLHLAAQSLVRRGYDDPRGTWETNVGGTIHLLDGLRSSSPPTAILVATSDKVYRPNPAAMPFREQAELGGNDPYSASKAAVEILVPAYAATYFDDAGVTLATARAGNVLGGGDFAPERLVPDVYRAVRRGEPLRLRNPQASRPWQHVLDCLVGYLRYLEVLAVSPLGIPRTLNFGPDHRHTLSVAAVAEAVGRRLGATQAWVPTPDPRCPEVPSLAIDATLASRCLGWRTRLDADETLAWTAEWYARTLRGESPADLVDEQIADYEKRFAIDPTRDPDLGQSRELDSGNHD